MKNKTIVTIKTLVNAPVKKIWEYWISPDHITNWNFASPEWHCPRAEHDLKVGGKLKYHMAAKDGSMGFDYTDTFTEILPQEKLNYRLDDNREVTIHFEEIDGRTQVAESFEIEDENSKEMQRQGWQAILDNFKKYVESN